MRVALSPGSPTPHAGGIWGVASHHGKQRRAIDIRVTATNRGSLVKKQIPLLQGDSRSELFELFEFSLTNIFVFVVARINLYKKRKHVYCMAQIIL